MNDGSDFTQQPQKLSVDCDFPGGHIIVDRLDGDTVFLGQSLRDTVEWWFYGYFRVRGAAGRTLSFQFTQGDVIGARGPAVSSDGGATWRWLGCEAVTHQAFTYTFAPDAADVGVRFSFSLPYVERDLQGRV